MQHMITLPIVPCPAPRQTRADAWKPRQCVLTYRQFRDDVALLWPQRLELPECPLIVFHLPIAQSKSAKAKARLVGTPHRQKPDIDNLQKAFLDALYRDSDDSHVWAVAARKVWALEGAIAVYDYPEMMAIAA